ncbi:MAG TPA: 50S ribosomal protein L17, partial [Oceanipulchritudo sp.]|nr:50S ribosomal protein L17 [Oceanipulchritudo sp.]
MRHQKHRFQLGRKKEHRAALMCNLGAALLRHGRIQTTLPKAKALRPFIEKIITLAKKAEGASPEKALHYRRLAMARIRDKDAVATLFNDRAAAFTGRTGGYTRIYKLGTRIGDAAEMAVIQLIPAEDEGYAKKPRKSSRSSKA